LGENNFAFGGKLEGFNQILAGTDQRTHHFNPIEHQTRNIEAH
jgi:hypothetical protein